MTCFALKVLETCVGGENSRNLLYLNSIGVLLLSSNAQSLHNESVNLHFVGWKNEPVPKQKTEQKKWSQLCFLQ